MASRVILVSSHRSVLQETNPGKENYQTVIHHGKERECDSDDESRGSKRRKVLPHYVTNADGANPRRRSRMQPESPIPSPTPLPSHVIARRNERERNRVRQVNESFAVLRSRIPDYFYEPDSDDGSKSSARKKLSKVETLRLAVDYIQQLEVLLDMKESSRESLSDDDRFHVFGSDTQGSFKTEESDRESDIMDLSSDRQYEKSPLDIVKKEVFDFSRGSNFLDLEHKPEVFENFSKCQDFLGLKGEMKGEGDDDVFKIGSSGDEAAEKSPLPPLNQTFPDKTYNHILYSPYSQHGLVDLSSKCD